jgi:hypothetical protein
MNDKNKSDEQNADRIIGLWNISNDTVHRLVLNELAIPWPANDPVESALNALKNLTQLEWQAVCDWLAENHWLPPEN